jgi:hypothetical protein
MTDAKTLYNTMKEFIIRRDKDYVYIDIPSVSIEVYNEKDEEYYEEDYHDMTSPYTLDEYLNSRYSNEKYQLREMTSHFVIDFVNDCYEMTTTSHNVI